MIIIVFDQRMCSGHLIQVRSSFMMTSFNHLPRQRENNRYPTGAQAQLAASTVMGRPGRAPRPLPLMPTPHGTTPHHKRGILRIPGKRCGCPNYLLGCGVCAPFACATLVYVHALGMPHVCLCALCLSVKSPCTPRR